MSQGRLVIGGHVMDVVSVRLVNAMLSITASDHSDAAYTLRPEDRYTVFGEDGRGICQGEFGMDPGLRKTAETFVNVTLNLRVSWVETDTRTHHVY
jgi:hypothetical protein